LSPLHGRAEGRKQLVVRAAGFGPRRIALPVSALDRMIDRVCRLLVLLPLAMASLGCVAVVHSHSFRCFPIRFDSTRFACRRKERKNIVRSEGD